MIGTSFPKKIIFHIGSPKCGSSALQKFMSEHPVLNMKNGQKFEYIGFLKNFGILRGTILKEFSKFSASKYINSYGLLDYLAKLDKDLVNEYFDTKNVDSVIFLSNEGWLGASHWMTTNDSVLLRSLLESDLLHVLHADIEILLYIRPQALLLNSSWWQWGAWTGLTFDEYLLNMIEEKSFKWAEVAKSFLKIPAVKKVHIRVLPKDVVLDFINFFNIEYNGSDLAKVNKSLSPCILRIFQRNRELRATPHASEIDFSLERQLDINNKPSPWVIDKKNLALILGNYRKDNFDLLEIVDDDQSRAILCDKKWWDIDGYNCVGESPSSSIMSMIELERISVKSFQAIADLDKKNSVYENFTNCIVENLFVYLVDFFDKNIVVDKDSLAISISRLASMYKEKKLVENATICYRLSTILSPQISEFHIEYSKCCFAKMDVENALNEAQVAVEIDPNHSEYWAYLASLYNASERIDLAEKCYEKSISINNREGWVHIEYAKILYRAGKIKKSIRELLASINFEPDNYEYFFHFGVLLQESLGILGCADSEDFGLFARAKDCFSSCQKKISSCFELKSGLSYSIDYVNGHSYERSKTYTLSKMFVMAGWVVEDEPKCVEGSLYIRIGDSDFAAHYGLIRTDVGDYFDDYNLRKSGFVAMIDLNDFCDCLYDVYFCYISHDKTRHYNVKLPFLIEIKKGCAPVLF